MGSPPTVPLRSFRLPDRGSSPPLDGTPAEGVAEGGRTHAYPPFGLTPGGLECPPGHLSHRQTVLIGTRTHTPPDSISSRLRLCISHVTTTYWDYIGSTWVWKSTTPHPLSPGDPWRLSYSVGTLGVRMCITERLEEDVVEEPPVELGIFQSCQFVSTSCL